MVVVDFLMAWVQRKEQISTKEFDALHTALFAAAATAAALRVRDDEPRGGLEALGRDVCAGLLAHARKGRAHPPHPQHGGAGVPGRRGPRALEGLRCRRGLRQPCLLLLGCRGIDQSGRPTFQHAFTQVPYALIAAVISIASYLVIAHL